MPRLAISTHDLLVGALLWAPGLLAASAAAMGLSPAGILAVAGLASLVATWIYAVRVALPRRRWLAELETWSEALWRATLPEALRDDAEPAPAAPPTGLNRLERALATLGRATPALLARLDQVQRERDNLRGMLDRGQSPVLATDARGVVVASNPAADQFFAPPTAGIGPAPSLVGRMVEDLFTQAEVLGQHAAALAGTARVGQLRVVRPDGVRVYQVLTAPLPWRALAGTGSLARGSQGPLAGTTPDRSLGALITMRDETDLSRAVQLKTDFVANASHELRTPLSSIKAAVETLSDGAWDDEPMRQRLAQVIAGNAQRLEEMVRDLLDLSRLDTPDAPVTLELVAFDDLAEQMRDTFDAVLRERRLTLEATAPTPAPLLETDRKLLTTILRNLIDNATKYAYEGTTVQVRASVLPAPDARHRPGLRLRVSDRGVGIPLGHQQRIFERFYQVDPSRAGFAARRGTGLGLAIVKHAVKALNGSVGVESVWREGTTMTVDLPNCVVTDVQATLRP